LLYSVDNAPTSRRAKIDPRTSRNTEHLQPQYSKGSCAPSAYAYDRKRNWILHFLARQEFTASEIEDCATESRSEMTDIAKTNVNRATTAQNATTPLQHVENQSWTSRNTKITATVRQRELRPLWCASRWKTDLDSPFSCPTMVYGIRDRGVRDGEAERKGRVRLKQHYHDHQQHDPIVKSKIILRQQRVDASKPTSEPHETPNITGTVRQRELRPFWCTPTMESRLGYSVSCPTTVYGFRD